MSNKQIILTLLGTQLFGWIGILATNQLNAPYLFPFLVGIAIPIMNWRQVNFVKWRITLVLGIVSTALFFGATGLAIWLSNFHLILAWLIAGLAGLAFLSLNSVFISSIRANWIAGTITFIFASVALPIGSEAFELFNKNGGDYLFLVWTFMVTLGLCSTRWTTKLVN